MNTNFSEILHQALRTILGQARNPLYKNSFFMAVSIILNAGAGFFFWVIAARLYTIEEVGVSAAIISIISVTLLLSKLGLDLALIRFFSIKEKGRVISTSLTITVAASIVIGFIFILMADQISSSIASINEFKNAIGFLLIAALSALVSVTGNAFIADRKSENYLFQNLFLSLRILILPPFAFMGSFGIIWSVGLGYLGASIFGINSLRKTINGIRPYIDLVFLRESFRFSSWNYVSSILIIAPTHIINIMVLNIAGEADAAKYFIAYQISMLAMIIPKSFSTSLFVEGSHGVGIKKSVIRAGIATAILLIPVVLVLLILGDRLLGMLKGEYVEAFDLLRIMTLSSFFFAIYELFISVQNIRMKVESIFKLNILNFILLLGLSYILIKQYGIMGAGYAWIMTYGICVLIIAIIALKERMFFSIKL